jgi:hypothetical protein
MPTYIHASSGIRTCDLKSMKFINKSLYAMSCHAKQRGTKVFELLFSSSFLIRPSGLFPIRINLDLWTAREVVELVGRVIIPVARTLPTQDKTNTE